jgi:hypothetical protein
LIASTIFAAVLLIASSAFKFFMSMGSRSVNSEQVMQEAISAIKVRDSIKGLHHYYLRDNAISLNDAKPFFWGSEAGFTGITLSSIDYEKQPTRISVSVLEGENSLRDLVYCEYDTTQEFPTYTITPECEYPIIVATGINTIEVDYFGWLSLNALFDSSATMGVNLTKKTDWSKNWDTTKRGLLPKFIKISIEYDEGKSTYQPRQLWFQITDADPVQFSVNTTNNE